MPIPAIAAHEFVDRVYASLKPGNPHAYLLSLEYDNGQWTILSKSPVTGKLVRGAIGQVVVEQSYSYFLRLWYLRALGGKVAFVNELRKRRAPVKEPA